MELHGIGAKGIHDPGAQISGGVQIPALRYARMNRMTASPRMRRLRRSTQMSWLPRSMNFVRPTSTTMRLPDWTYTSVALTSSCVLLRGQKPWLCSLKAGSINGCSACSRACWIGRSVNIG